MSAKPRSLRARRSASCKVLQHAALAMASRRRFTTTRLARPANGAASGCAMRSLSGAAAMRSARSAVPIGNLALPRASKLRPPRRPRSSERLVELLELSRELVDDLDFLFGGKPRWHQSGANVPFDVTHS